ncbi:GNAT family N-acetyltransferase [Jeotgalibacillus sp. ET6]|uniref:GNAT family N-acetyltransferase n=1 Tax=Jeotgalibacillus sp. ET6 TaxID=3037260 RepID=UPI002418646C|nr:GNAT family N-acetyltransferase [Jeotgalibacillus sp. ET6]MDG5471866.1 GNAT family N-acetyltransferase [Jeotgalibacillus sp. ET6]
MYQYYKGLIIREGTSGVPAEQVKKLFEEAGWVRGVPEWQMEKFSLLFENSAWAFTVWSGEEMVGMVRVISDKIMAGNIMDLVVQKKWQGKGIGQKLVSLCVAKLPHGDWFAHTSADNFTFYKRCGFEVKDLKKNGTCAYYGYIQAKKDGDRL